jgi:hypothetical protein
MPSHAVRSPTAKMCEPGNAATPWLYARVTFIRIRASSSAPRAARRGAARRAAKIFYWLMSAHSGTSRDTLPATRPEGREARRLVRRHIVIETRPRPALRSTRALPWPSRAIQNSTRTRGQIAIDKLKNRTRADPCLFERRRVGKRARTRSSSRHSAVVYARRAMSKART